MQNINIIGQPSPTPNDCEGQVIPASIDDCTSNGAFPLHNSLDGLQGGTINERYHLTKAQHDGLVNPLGTFMDLLTNQTADGIKTFLQSPQVPVGSNPSDAVQFSQLADITVGAGNGLTNNAGIIGLGGELDGASNIDLSTFVLSFTNGAITLNHAPTNPTDLVRLQDLDYVDSILSGLTLTVVGSNVTVAPGTWRIHNIRYATTSTTTLPLDSQDGTLSRFDAIYADTTNAIHILSGTLSSNPDVPNIPSNTVLVGTVLITPTSVTTIPQPITNYVTTNTTQTITGLKTINNKLIISSGNGQANGNQFTGTTNFISTSASTGGDRFAVNINGTLGSGALNVIAGDSSFGGGVSMNVGGVSQSWLYFNSIATDAGHNPQIGIINLDTSENQLGPGHGLLIRNFWHGDKGIFINGGNIYDQDGAVFLKTGTPILNGTSTAGYVWTATDTVGNGSWQAATGGGGGGVSSIAVATANGVSGTSSGGSNPSLTMVLGDITPTSVTATTGGASINAATGNITTFKSAGSTVALISSDGLLRGPGLCDDTSSNNSFLSISTKGARFSRSIADSNPALIVVNNNTAANGLVFNVQNYYRSLLYVDANGAIRQSTITEAGLGSAKGYWMIGGLKPTANNDVLMGMLIEPIYGTSTVTVANTLVGGTGYPNGTQLATFTGGTGFNLVAQVTVVSGVITGFTITDGGINYTVGDVVTFVIQDATGTPTGSGGTITISTVASYTGVTNYALVTKSAASMFAPSTSSYGSIIVPAGTTYSGSTDGTIWQDGTHLYAFINGAPRQLDQQTGGGTGVSAISIATSGGVSGTSSGGGTPTLTFTLRSSVREVPSGAKNGSNTAFGLANTPLTSKEMLFLNGILLNATDDYTIAGAAVTMLVAPVSTDKLLAFYPY
jgi:hypothetical protein